MPKYKAEQRRFVGTSGLQHIWQTSRPFYGTSTFPILVQLSGAWCPLVLVHSLTGTMNGAPVHRAFHLSGKTVLQLCTVWGLDGWSTSYAEHFLTSKADLDPAQKIHMDPADPFITFLECAVSAPTSTAASEPSDHLRCPFHMLPPSRIAVAFINCRYSAFLWMSLKIGVGHEKSLFVINKCFRQWLCTIMYLILK